MGPTISKGQLYDVYSTVPLVNGGASVANAPCKTIHDILMHGGCSYTAQPSSFFSTSLNATDPNQPAEWQCSASGASGQVTAHAVCLAVP